MENESLNALLQALSFSPDNAQLRTLVVQELIKAKDWTETEKHAKYLLDKEPGNSIYKRFLAEAYFGQDKFATSIIIFEELYGERMLTDRLQILYANALLKEGDMPMAKDVYQSAIKSNPDLADAQLDNAFRVNSINKSEDEGIDDDFVRNALGLNKSTIDFSHVGGMTDVKKEIELKIIKPFKHPEIYKAYGKKAGGGILLYGPPGCGKTHIAKATAGEVEANFLSIGINDILDAWLGNSEKNLHELFETARRNTPCVLFIDEVDALGANRTDMKGVAGRNVVNQFLAELDGADANNEGVLVLAATNSPWHLDPAFKRPGRFDRMIFVSPPDESARATIAEIMLKDKPAEQINYAKLAKQTKSFSGADLQAVVDMAVEKKLEEAFDTGNIDLITTKDLLSVMKRVRPSTKEWFGKARNYALYANESGNYNDILEYLKRHKI